MMKQAVILAAGESSRFTPYSAQAHKSETLLMGKPIIYWTLDSLAEATFDEVVVVVNQSNQTLAQLLKAYPNKFKKFTIVNQHQALGMGDALLSAQEYLGERFVVLHAHHVDGGQLGSKLLAQQQDVVVCGQPTTHPELYGIVTIKDDLATTLIEKPQSSVENPYRIVGTYVITQEILNLIKDHPTEEYAFEKILNQYMQDHQVAGYIATDPSPSLKYAWHLFDLRDHLFKKLKFEISPDAQIASTAVLHGDVHIEPGAIIADYAIVEGPVYIGPQAVVGSFCVARKNTVLEAGAEIQRYADANNSILMSKAHLHSGFVGNSILGENCRIGAGFITANRRLDRATINCYVKNQKVDTKMDRLGAIIGHNVKIGINSNTMPGVIIKNDTIIKPNTGIEKNL